MNERSSLYRREHQKEAKVWQERGRQSDALDDDEDRQTDAELKLHAALVRTALNSGFQTSRKMCLFLILCLLRASVELSVVLVSYIYGCEFFLYFSLFRFRCPALMPTLFLH